MSNATTCNNATTCYYLLLLATNLSYKANEMRAQLCRDSAPHYYLLLSATTCYYLLLLATHLAHDTAEVGAELCGISAPGTPALEEPLVSQQRPPQQVGLVRGQVLAVEASVVIIIVV